MILLGVDPGLRTTGYGAVEFVSARSPRLIEGGVLRPDPSSSLERRLHDLHAGMCEVVRAIRPQRMIVEELWSAYEHPQTAVLMGHARGVLCLAAGSNGVAVETLAHSLVKRALVGSGSGRKAQVAAMVARMLGLAVVPEPYDVTDALALAIAYGLREGVATR